VLLSLPLSPDDELLEKEEEEEEEEEELLELLELLGEPVGLSEEGGLVHHFLQSLSLYLQPPFILILNILIRLSSVLFFSPLIKSHFVRTR
jgi:hypothetical protein